MSKASAKGHHDEAQSRLAYDVLIPSAGDPFAHPLNRGPCLARADTATHQEAMFMKVGRFAYRLADQQGYYPIGEFHIEA